MIDACVIVILFCRISYQILILNKDHKQYARYDKPELSCDKLVTGGLDIYELPVYPAGMVVEPFVRLLAEELRVCIDKALEM